MAEVPLDDGNGNGNGSGHGSGAVLMAAGLEGRVSLLEVASRDLKNDVAKLERMIESGFERIGTLSMTNRDRAEAAVQGLREAVALRDRPNYPMVVGLCVGGFGVIATLSGGAYFLTSQQTQVLVQPLALRSEVVTQAVASNAARLDRFETAWREVDRQLQYNESRDSRSEQDRADMRARLDRQADQLAGMSGDIRAIRGALTEVETQFRADEQTAAMRDQYQQRWNGIFYQKVFGQEMPSLGPQAPGIARGPVAGGGDGGERR